jgi:GNAT superfamily N-acetyltransferase
MAADLGLIERVDRANAAVFATSADTTPGGRVARQDGLLLVIGTDPSPVIVNTILIEAPAATRAAIERAVEVYRAVGHVPSLMTRDHLDDALATDLQAHGWRRLLGLPGMVLESPLPAGATLHPVATDADRERWIEGNLNGFAEDESEQSALRSAFQTLASLHGEDVTAWWIEVDGRGVASSATWLDRETGVGIVGWVGTDRAYRRRGLGRAVTLATINAGFTKGATVIALQASPMGLPVYEKLGFRTITGYKIWLPPGD